MNTAECSWCEGNLAPGELCACNTQPDPCPTCGALPCDQVNSVSRSSNSVDANSRSSSGGRTPGSWRLNAGNEIEVMGANLPIARAQCGGTSGIRLAEAEANARLIAAAPELLETLTELVLYHDVPDSAQDPVALPLIRNALAAIAKAA